MYIVPILGGKSKEMSEKEFNKCTTEKYINGAVDEENRKREKAKMEYEKSNQ